MTTREEIKVAYDALSTALNSFDDEERAQAFYECLTRDHRTLQQTYWRMMIHVIMKYSDARYDDRNEASVRLCNTLSECLEEALYHDLPTI